MMSNLIQRVVARARRKISEKLLSADTQAVRRARLTMLSPERLYRIERALARVNRARVEGDFAEFGVALGGSAIMAAKRLQGNRRFVGFDVFGMIPPPGAADSEDSHKRYQAITAGKSHGIDGDTYYGYVEDLFGKVSASFAEQGIPVDGKRVSLVKGLFADTIPTHLPERIAYAHVDCDWHDPVRDCLEALARTMTPRGIIIIDDYTSFDGCRRATDAFLATHWDFRLASPRLNAVVERR